jgi:hypothetical protein
LADYANDSYLLVHRAGDGQVEWHETQADVFFVLSGTATLLLGGKMVNGYGTGRSSAAFASPSLQATSCAFRPAYRISVVEWIIRIRLFRS